MHGACEGDSDGAAVTAHRLAIPAGSRRRWVWAAKHRPRPTVEVSGDEDEHAGPSANGAAGRKRRRRMVTERDVVHETARQSTRDPGGGPDTSEDDAPGGGMTASQVRLLRAGARVQVWCAATEQGRPAGWWNAIVRTSGVAMTPTAVAVIVDMGDRPHTVDGGEMSQSVRISRRDVETVVMRAGWRTAATDDAAPVVATGRGRERRRRGDVRRMDGGGSAAAAVGDARAHRLRTYEANAARRAASGRRARARAVMAANAVHQPAVRWHRQLLATRPIRPGMTMVWDVCSGPFKSMAMAAEIMFHGAHAFTLDWEGMFNPDQTARFEEWQPFQFMLDNYLVGDSVVMPWHFHFSPTCQTFCQQSQGLHRRTADEPWGRPDAPAVAWDGTRLVMAMAAFQRILTTMEGANPTFSWENPVGALQHLLRQTGAAAQLRQYKVDYCRYGSANRKPTHIFLSAAVAGFTPLVCHRAAQHPQRGACGRLARAADGTWVHDGDEGGKTIEDAVIPPLLCGDILRAVLGHHGVVQAGRRRTYNVVDARHVRAARTQWAAAMAALPAARPAQDASQRDARAEADRTGTLEGEERAIGAPRDEPDANEGATLRRRRRPACEACGRAVAGVRVLVGSKKVCSACQMRG